MKNDNKLPLLLLAGAFLLSTGASGQTTSSNSHPQLKISDKDIVNALKFIRDKYGIEVAKEVERVYRWETNHFASGQFLESRSAGMVATSDKFPYGWSKFRTMWESVPQMKPIGVTDPFRVQGKDYRYVKFPSMVAAMIPLASVIKAGGADAWAGVPGYANTISSVIPRYVNALT